jgi:hypothetical protein
LWATDLIIKNRTVKYFDEDETPISVSTGPQMGRAVAAILILPVETLDTYRNKVIYVNSFTITQREMLAFLQRVTHTSDAGWSITHLQGPSCARHQIESRPTS